MPESPSTQEESDSMASKGLGRYFLFIRNAIYPSTGSGSSRVRLVLGNPSADLDSFISAVIFSFFSNTRSRQHSAGSGGQNQNSVTYVPLINLSDVPSKDLWRLRQEFATAVGLAMGYGTGEQGQQKSRVMLKQLVTISDLRNDHKSVFREIFAPSLATDEAKTSNSSERAQKQEVILVDHNVPSIPGISQKDIEARLELVGCIDHHVDEKYVSNEAKPRIIRTGIGSCTSLVIKHLRDEGLWPVHVPPEPVKGAEQEHDNEEEESTLQIAKLALAPILIDTSNLKAPGEKCSDLDRETVSFLLEYIDNHPSSAAKPDSKFSATVRSNFDTNAFFDAIRESKSSSLDKLTMPEIFERDYKEWTERRQTGSGEEVKIGISSIVRQLDWLCRHAGSNEKLVSEIEKFIESHDLGVFALLTKPNSNGKGREVVVVISSSKDEEKRLGEAISRFEKTGKHDLDLSTEWIEDESFRECMDSSFGGDGKKGRWKIWWQRDMSKTRKQVGPLLRSAVRDS